ncbi:MAG: hypothetical protein ABW051_10380 [Burkholderiaceae bacterium]
MSFLNQLKSQASALQNQQQTQHESLAANTLQVENACKTVQHYFTDLARQLNVIVPAAPRFTLDGKTPWPAMKLVDFRVDARRKMLRDKEAFDVLSIGWEVVPQLGKPVGGVVSANFPPDLERIQARLSAGNVQHERKEVRHPEKNTLQAYRYEYITQTRGSVMVRPDHDKGTLAFRVANADGFGVANVALPAAQVQTGLLDELAKLIVAQPSTFL